MLRYTRRNTWICNMLNFHALTHARTTEIIKLRFRQLLHSIWNCQISKKKLSLSNGFRYHFTNKHWNSILAELRLNKSHIICVPVRVISPYCPGSIFHYCLVETQMKYKTIYHNIQLFIRAFIHPISIDLFLRCSTSELFNWTLFGYVFRGNLFQWPAAVTVELQRLPSETGKKQNQNVFKSNIEQFGLVSNKRFSKLTLQCLIFLASVETLLISKFRIRLPTTKEVSTDSPCSRFFFPNNNWVTKRKFDMA